MLQAFGDSITAGLGASSPNKSWVGRLTPDNRGWSSAQAADIAAQVLVAAQQPDGSNNYSVAVGCNDIYKYRNDPIKKGYFRKFLTAILAWLSLPVKDYAQDLGRIGSWHNAMVNGHGLACNGIGNILTGGVKGRRLFVGHTIQNYPTTIGVADVIVGGNLVGQIHCNAAGMDTNLGRTYAPAVSAFDIGCDPDLIQDVEIVTVSGGNFFLDWIAGEQDDGPRVLVGNILKWSDLSYAKNQLTSQTTVDYNAIIAEVIGYFPKAQLVDNYSIINPLLHLADGVHPNDLGHALISANFRHALTRTLT